MTVAAIILVPDTPTALGDADGEPAVRRVAHAAWAGGALPIVLVSNEVAGPLAEAVADLPVTPVLVTCGGPPGIAWFVDGQRAAVAAVAAATAGLLWPFRHAWVDPETVTSLVEAHGAAPESIVQPAFGGQTGFPILVPMGLTGQLAAHAGLHGPEAVAALIAEGVPARVLELGDPGIVHDLATPGSNLPGYQGPPGPVGGPAPEWNSELAAHAERSGDTSG
ncbi:MAG: NTP transferase domain-containing protein [Candidatus Limnocylindrales bacterium]|jgi:CTP:molybdopterin cytidylyltransferase MocA